MNVFIEAVGFGIAAGAVIALGAVGFTVQFGISNVLNITYGALMTLAAYLGYALLSVGVGVWAALAAEMSREHFVLAPDLFGHGMSAKPMGDYSLGGHAAVVPVQAEPARRGHAGGPLGMPRRGRRADHDQGHRHIEQALRFQSGPRPAP